MRCSGPPEWVLIQLARHLRTRSVGQASADQQVLRGQDPEEDRDPEVQADRPRAEREPDPVNAQSPLHCRPSLSQIHL